MENSIFVRFKDGEILKTNSIQPSIFGNAVKCCDNIIDLLEIGDLVTIEYYSLRENKRVSRLFLVEYIWGDRHLFSLTNAHMTFAIRDNEFCEDDLSPVIKSIITKEKIENNKYDFVNENVKTLTLK